MEIKVKNFSIGNKNLSIMAGPCAMESYDICAKTADVLKKITSELDINYIFKCSFDKANRSSITSYRGLGLEKGLEILSKIKSEFDLPIVTDIHLPEQASIAAEIADILQIPAFLCRQTDLLVAAAKTGKVINIKKGQFLAPQQMKTLVKKVESCNNKNILLTDRGVSFGYNNLVTDFRAIPIMQETGYPVIFDATHSVQLPGTNEGSTGGDRRFVPLLAKAAVAAGVNGLFFEIHPEPENALCDGDNMLPLSQAKEVFETCKKIWECVR
ncbi:3-deoxy-8-phosphooctulonate synthase [bacterium]|nr:3-deoxy-8-phosphooctulonate synthase [bacterium]